jgi:dTDP-4-dehydrorhamnose 3,5-epimerase
LTFASRDRREQLTIWHAAFWKQDVTKSIIESVLTGGTQLHGVRLESLVSHRDERGVFTEIFSSAWDAGIRPAQWSVVSSNKGVFRGMHLHRRHDEYFLLIKGRACVGLHDLRTASPTAACWSVYELSGAQLTFLSFPPGIVHGWYFYEDAIHVQAVSESYESYRDDDNLGCRWDDPDLGIKWPFDAPVLSEEAAQFPSLCELRQQLGF